MISAITNSFLERTTRLRVEPEVTAGKSHFSMFNDGGVEVETAEFLYGLVRLLKPNDVLETGTHLGVSSAYIAQGLEDNQMGQITTLEVIPELRQSSLATWQALGLSHRITSLLVDSRDYTHPNKIDFLFLDSEPHYRFQEFERFWPMVRPGGFIAIHDIGGNLASQMTAEGPKFPSIFGDFRQLIGPRMLDHSIQTMSFDGARGLVLFQKTRNDFAFTQHLRGEM